MITKVPTIEYIFNSKTKGDIMKYKAIIFDMDGTITDSEHIWKSTTKELLTSKGVQVTDELHNELEKELKEIGRAHV